MRTVPRIKLFAFVLALIGMGFTAPTVDAGTRDKTVCRTSSQYSVEFNSGRHHDRGWHSSRSHTRHHNDGFNFSIRVGSSDRHHYNRGCDSRFNTRRVVYHSDRHYRGHRDYYDYPRTSTFTRSSCDVRPTRTVVVTNHHRGYYKRVFVPAVYETRYYACGTPYRICTRASYYKRVWVSGSSCH